MTPREAEHIVVRPYAITNEFLYNHPLIGLVADQKSHHFLIGDKPDYTPRMSRCVPVVHQQIDLRDNGVTTFKTIDMAATLAQVWDDFQNIDELHRTPDGGRSLMVGDICLVEQCTKSLRGRAFRGTWWFIGTYGPFRIREPAWGFGASYKECEKFMV